MLYMHYSKDSLHLEEKKKFYLIMDLLQIIIIDVLSTSEQRSVDKMNFRGKNEGQW